MRAKRLYRRGEQLELDIHKVAFGGKGISKIQTEEGDFTVFVQNAIVGQKVLARVVKCKRKYAECKLDKVLVRSPQEQEIEFQPIPGAPYATLPIEIQRQFKQETTFDLFKKIGQIEDVESLFDEYVESPSIWHYRNKMEYSFSEIRFDLELEEERDDFGLGFKHRGTWWAVENLDKDSGLFDQELENKLHEVKQWCWDSNLPSWHPPQRKGFYRYFVVRKSFDNDQLLINLVTTSHYLDDFNQKEFIALLLSLWGDRIKGIQHTINDSMGDRTEASEGSSSLIYGDSKITEDILGLKFEISMKSFFQTNPKCAEKLYSKVLEYAGEAPNKGDVLMDLFCGTGTIAQLMARDSGWDVIGVDIVESAIEDARKNALRNKLEGLKFFALDAGKFLYNHPEYQNKINTIVLDPPRGGIAPKTLRKVIALNSKRIVYVSCNPATQARDMATLKEAGYDLQKFSLVDQFPHTSHVESVALFELK